MFSEVVKSKLKNLDIYRKTPKDLTEGTISGGLVSIVACAFMSILFLTELSVYLRTSTFSEMYVDTARGGEKLIVNLDITFHNYPCALMSLDAQEVIGSHTLEYSGRVKKLRLNPQGTIIGGSDLLQKGETSEEEVKKQLTDSEGCRLMGYLSVSKVPGNFHFSSHEFYHNVHNLVEGNMGRLDLSHTINHLSFGDNDDIVYIKTHFSEGELNPLDNLKKIRPSNTQEPFSYEYYLKVVPTTFKTLQGKEFYVHQITANSNEFRTNGMPAVYFRYDLSPVTVKFTLTQQSIYHFLVQVCAIVGGVFTVAGLVEQFLNASVQSVLKKKKTTDLGN